MPDPIPEEALQAATQVLAAGAFTDKTFRGYARAVLEAAAPAFAATQEEARADERRTVAERIAAEIDAACPEPGVRHVIPCDYQTAASIARKIGQAP